MAFVQLIHFKSSRIDEMRKLVDEWTERAGPTTTAQRAVLCEDRDNPGRYFQVVFFDSYASAMQNSESPITQSSRRGWQHSVTACRPFTTSTSSRIERIER
jgi:hypothetical protein